MKIIKWILKFKEYLTEIKKVMNQGYWEEDWMNQPCVSDWVVVLIMVLICPTSIILFLGCKFHFWMSLPLISLTYLIFGIIFSIMTLCQEIKWVRDNRERHPYSKERIERLQRLLDEIELSEITCQDEKESQKAKQKEPGPKRPGKDQ